jgi:phosphatidate phosphatase PAH1
MNFWLSQKLSLDHVSQKIKSKKRKKKKKKEQNHTITKTRTIKHPVVPLNSFKIYPSKENEISDKKFAIQKTMKLQYIA